MGWLKDKSLNILRTVIFLRNKKIINLCLRLHILRNYCFVGKVTFKSYFLNNIKQTRQTDRQAETQRETEKCDFLSVILALTFEMSFCSCIEHSCFAYSVEFFSRNENLVILSRIIMRGFYFCETIHQYLKILRENYCLVSF